MSKKVYGYAGIYPDPTKNDGKVDNEEEVYALLEGFKEGDKLKEILSHFALKSATPTIITVTNITALTGEQLEALRTGDIVLKSDLTGEHAYTVSYKGPGGLCLTYADCENVETVAYQKSEDTWSYDSTDITHIGG